MSKPVCKIVGFDEFGPLLEWSEHWSKFPVGTALAAIDAASPPAPAVPAAFESDKGETNGRNDGLRSALHGRVSLGDRAYGALVDGLFASDDVMSLNAELGLTMDQLVRLVQATHAALASQPAAQEKP